MNSQIIIRIVFDGITTPLNKQSHWTKLNNKINSIKAMEETHKDMTATNIVNELRSDLLADRSES